MKFNKRNRFVKDRFRELFGPEVNDDKITGLSVETIKKLTRAEKIAKAFGNRTFIFDGVKFSK